MARQLPKREYLDVTPPNARKPLEVGCFRCDGTGLICDICGESEAACHRHEEDGQTATYSECPDCREQA